jgi:hypothetical protein
MKKILILLFTLIFIFADDICYEPIQTEDMFCLNVGPCGGGIGCKKTYPIKNISNSTLSNMKIYYDETKLGGTFGKHCGTDPDGNCNSVDDIDFGPFGFFNSATEFSFNENMNPNDEFDVWIKNWMEAKCFYGDRLYAEYDKNDVHYKVKIYPCSEASNSNDTFYNGNYVDFKLIDQENIFGNIISVGNTNECVTSIKALNKNNINLLYNVPCENNMNKYYNNPNCYLKSKFL